MEPNLTEMDLVTYLRSGKFPMTCLPHNIFMYLSQQRAAGRTAEESVFESL
jgi:hypothetical protein